MSNHTSNATYCQKTKLGGHDKLDNSNVPETLKVAKTRIEFNKIWAFRKKEYGRVLPNITGFNNDKHDDYASVLFTENSDGDLTSTGRIVFDNPLGLPEENLVSNLIKGHRQAGLRLAEYGRVIIRDTGKDLLKEYFKAAYLIAINNNIDSIIVVSKQKDVPFYTKMIGAVLLSDDVGETFGGKDPYACVDWKISNTKPRFFSWCNLHRSEPQPQQLSGV